MSSSSSSSSNTPQEWNWNRFLDNIPILYWEDDVDECFCELESGFRSFVCLMNNEECPKDQQQMKENKMFHLD